MKMLSAARHYATWLGWPVLPVYGITHDHKCTCGNPDCQTPGKHPRTRNGVKDATTNLEQISAWWASHPQDNVAIACSPALFVLDVDGPAGEASLASLMRGASLPETIEQNTGRGRHLFFSFADPSATVSNRRIAPGLDVRGTGGYVVASPSLHASGKSYSWTIPPTPGQLGAIPPAWLVDALDSANPALTTGPDAARRMLNQKAAMPVPAAMLRTADGVEAGQRDERLFRYACWLRASGAEYADAIRLVAAAAGKCTPPFSERDAKAKVDSAWKYPAYQSERATPADIFQPESVNLLSHLKRRDPTAYARIRAELKGQVDLRDLDRAVKYADKPTTAVSPLRLAGPDDVPPPLPPGKEHLTLPSGWVITPRGVFTADGEAACNAPLIPSRRLKVLGSDEERLELCYWRDEAWHTVAVQRSVAFQSSRVCQLADLGLPVNSEDSRRFVRYLTAFEALGELPLVLAAPHTGWLPDNRFYPGMADDVVAAGQLSAYHPRGKLSDWYALVKPLRSNHVFRFVLASAFGAPLLRPLGQRPFVIHLWGESRTGKTAALWAALSAWGSPQELLSTFYATRAGLEYTAQTHCDLPLGVDELQTMTARREMLDGIVYMFGLGQGKLRGARGGGMQLTPKWHSIVLTTGEEPLTRSNSTTGIFTRALEVGTSPFYSEAEAAQLYKELPSLYGTAGPAFIRAISALPVSRATSLFAGILATLTHRFGTNLSSHVSAAAVAATADALVSELLLGVNAPVAEAEAVLLASAILSREVPVAEDISYASRALEWVWSWLTQHSMRFTLDQHGSAGAYGRVRHDVLEVYVLSHIFEAAVEEAGFSLRRVLDALITAGQLHTDADSKYKRTVRLWGQPVKVIAIKIPADYQDFASFSP